MFITLTEIHNGITEAIRVNVNHIRDYITHKGETKLTFSGTDGDSITVLENANDIDTLVAKAIAEPLEYAEMMRAHNNASQANR